MHGKGKLIYSNGDIYEGGFFEGKKFGDGAYTWSSTKAVYRGKWNHDKMHGEGSLTDQHGSVKKIKYLNGKEVPVSDTRTISKFSIRDDI
uniref:MORN repeat protein n=1 Tax=uncultured bacterium A1Q1_fos_504 TaxID=1256580 RepID=L7VRT2_9BACT|nr:hypothetical protein [uncultured bacterium A1Q1_fos_504]